MMVIYVLSRDINFQVKIIMTCEYHKSKTCGNKSAFEFSLRSHQSKSFSTCSQDHVMCTNPNLSGARKETSSPVIYVGTQSLQLPGTR